MNVSKVDDVTKWYKSKRFYVTLVTAILPMIPPVASFAAAFPEMYHGMLAALFGWVGIKTTKRLSFKG